MPYKIGETDLFALDYAKNNHIALPVDADASDVFNRDALESLCKVVPKNNSVVINNFRVKCTCSGYEAAFVWRYPHTDYSCITEYWGDGIYYLTGVTSDNTVVRIMFDDHCISSKTEGLGDKMASELLEALIKEEEYSHVEIGYGRVKRLCRLPEKVNRYQLLDERYKLMQKRLKYLAKKSVASGSGIKVWENEISRIEEELFENKQLLAMVKG